MIDKACHNPADELNRRTKQRLSHRLSIAIVSDFFVPSLGGVEMHMYNVAECLIEMGHKVIVISTNFGGERIGLRVLPNLLKVYHLPLNMMVSGVSWCDAFTLYMPILRHLFIRENIEIVHGHQATSVLQQHSLLVAQYMGLKTVFTDHSLFGFVDIASFYLNKYLKWHLGLIDACISVSHANKDNLTLRAAVDPSKIYVIPNSVDTL